MSTKGPLLTLGAVAVLGAALLLANISNESSPPQSTTPSAPSVSASASPGSPQSPTQSPPEAFPAKADYVGKIPIHRGVMTLEITVEGDKAIAYACDGKSVEVWLRGSAVNGTVSLDNKDRTSHLTGHLVGGSVTGVLSIDQDQWNFTAAPAQPPAGLYVYLENGSRDSWIIDQNNGVTGVVRRPDGSKSPAPTLSINGTAVINDKTITATRVEGNSNVV
ncbi:hypothetical protein [Mycobacterium sp. 852002-51057_SCH5723018]|uniref:hypothetical protein n=1 Tax=Mycobacterium sp. 852002-51057_SCH5723018 TaxID=1834094 RepID=UPI0008013C10|nr:hypothetical protein [Mycobacterium sp. 852002-51057_SCH5723018]OBG28726.1 hypothetical protein A5764_24265 [Mycobacterium sp. 852002-51057_SCH5723018]